MNPWALALLLYALGFFQAIGWAADGTWSTGYSANVKVLFAIFWPLMMLATVIVAACILIKRGIK